MKIACIISSLCLGGAERQLVYLADTLHKEGHDVEIITYHPGGFYSEAAQNLGLKVNQMDLKGGSVAFSRRLAAYLKAEAFDAAVAFLVGASTKACMAHVFYPGFRLFVSERCLNKSYLPHDALRFLLFRRAEKIICNSHAQGDFVRIHCPRLSGKLCVIPNFVDTEAFRPQPCTRCRGHRRILVTARGSHRKNALGLIRAAAFLQQRGVGDFVIDWYGMTEGSTYEKKCLALIERCGLHDIVRLHPSQKNVADLYHDADIFCLPSFYEGTSNSLAEALSCGLPAACSNVSDNALYVHEGRNGMLFDPDSSSSIADALQKLLVMNDDQLARMGIQSRRIATELLGRDSYSALYRELF